MADKTICCRFIDVLLDYPTESSQPKVAVKISDEHGTHWKYYTVFADKMEKSLFYKFVKSWAHISYSTKSGCYVVGTSTLRLLATTSLELHIREGITMPKKIGCYRVVSADKQKDQISSYWTEFRKELCDAWINCILCESKSVEVRVFAEKKNPKKCDGALGAFVIEHNKITAYIGSGWSNEILTRLELIKNKGPSPTHYTLSSNWSEILNAWE